VTSRGNIVCLQYCFSLNQGCCTLFIPIYYLAYLLSTSVLFILSRKLHFMNRDGVRMHLDSYIYRVLQKEIYNFESLYQFIQRICTESLYGWQSVSMSWCWAHFVDVWPDIAWVWNLLSCVCGAPSLTRGRVCPL
jgi:hypothetical protein